MTERRQRNSAATGALDAFFDAHYRLNPVSATFTGVHAHDARLPDWSPAGLAAQEAEEGALAGALAAAARAATGWGRVDADLALGHLEIRHAQLAGKHGVRGNPALWTGEAVFGPISLMLATAPDAPARAESLAARLAAIPAFLDDARAVLGEGDMPETWTARAVRECSGAARLMEDGIARWLATHSGGRVAPERGDARGATGERFVSSDIAARVRAAADAAGTAFASLAIWLRARPVADARVMACGPDAFDLLLRRGHHTLRTRADLLAETTGRFADESAKLKADAESLAGSWAAAQEQMAAEQPAAGTFLAAFHDTWNRCRSAAQQRDLVTWPEWPVRYVFQPDWARSAAPSLYFLPYRSPAPFDDVASHQYLIAPIDAANPDGYLRAWNTSVITLNHVVHHGAIGHHVQNWHAYQRSQSRIGRVAAVDCASHISMFCGGSMAEGWACYATELMDEAGFLSPLERLSQQHSRVRFLARAIVDISLHEGSMTFADAVQYYVERVGMTPAAAAAEATKNSMFPGTGLMYWLGTQGILDMRAERQRRDGPAFTMRGFHDDLLSHGSIPVPLVARLMCGGAA